MLTCSADESKDMSATINSQPYLDCEGNARVSSADVAELVLSGCHFGTMPTNLLDKFEHLQAFAFIHGDLPTLRVADLPRHRDQLQSLVVVNSRLAAIDQQVFGALPALTELDISKNLIRVCPNFWAATNLEELNLEQNYIDNQNIPIGAFAGLDSLKVLRFGSNELTTAKLPYANLPALRQLGLQRNRIKVVGGADFVHLADLEVLDVSGMELEQIEDGALAPLVELRSLDLSQNQLKKLDFGIFLPAMPHLSKLNLADMGLTELSDDFDQLFPELDQLIIQSNKFECSYLEHFLRTLRKRPQAIDANESDANQYRRNYRGVLCADGQKSEETPAPAETKSVPRDFESGYNVSIFVLALWIAVTNLVICGAIVLAARKFTG